MAIDLLSANRYNIDKRIEVRFFMYDIIIIGAGPCGCTAARTLSTSGFKVLLLEKCKLPRYKSCSGILIEKSMRFIEQKFGCSVPAFVTCTPIDNRGMIFTDDIGREYRFESRGLNIWRDKFDYWLVSLAQEAGTEVRAESSVTSIRESKETVEVMVNGNTEQAQYVIDCSGAVGINKRDDSSTILLPNGVKRLGGKSGVCKQSHNNVITFQTYNNGVINLDPHYFYAYLQPELSGYDAWFNVKDDMLVLGVASVKQSDIKQYYGAFEAYMQEKHGLCISKQLRTDKWLIRNIKPPFSIDYGIGGVLKAGENAGFLNPMGEGISCGMESGYYAALAIISDFNNRQNVIENYKSNVSDVKNYMQRQWQLVGRMSKKFSFMYQ